MIFILNQGIFYRGGGGGFKIENDDMCINEYSVVLRVVCLILNYQCMFIVLYIFQF